MPVTLLIALVLAFGLDLDAGTGPGSGAPVAARSALVDVGLMAVGFAVVSRLAGVRIARGADRGAWPYLTVRRRLHRRSRGLDAASLGLFGVALYGLSWRRAVDEGLGLSGFVLLDELALLLPFLAMQLGMWWGLYPAERAARGLAPTGRPFPGLGHHLLMRARQSLGMVLPAALLYVLAYDLAQRYAPGRAASPAWQFAGLATVGAALLVLAPALVRLSWPTRRLPDGPLRARLDTLARRLGFRFTDILVWDTDYTLVNAGVTGALPGFRYVLLTDSLIEALDPYEIEAVFGHEIGHVAHRHLAYFGFFFVGSMGLMALVAQGLTWLASRAPVDLDAVPPLALEVAAAVGWLTIFLVYMFAIFGFLSRRFERQADIFGCRAVSCGREACPPHADPNHEAAPARAGVAADPCPIGIRIFARALANVAVLNGMEPQARSWRHGSIRRRIDFLEGLEGDPRALRRFQLRIGCLRLGLALVLLAGIVTALATGALEQL
jgi:STE24 endopeptidase